MMMEAESVSSEVMALKAYVLTMNSLLARACDLQFRSKVSEHKGPFGETVKIDIASGIQRYVTKTSITS